MIKRLLKSERGLTLIELLAVVVILGIIAAIAIPAIGGLIDNSKKDAHVSNAQQMINATKIAVTSDKDLIPDNGKYTLVYLNYLENEGYLETVKDPDGNTNSYKKGPSTSNQPRKNLSGDPKTSYSYVLIQQDNNNKLSYYVKLINSKRGIQKGDGSAVAESELKRSEVRDN
ncbi:prepilin-type N-terminal cleavage/methylation domain-containing protein [Parageobacillus toebii]|uniref:Uncharacterized protein n=1 Tax=Parageobacillus toebii TaxID=153151 RepID=A0A150N837_9BACL|nr:prepilin-type N-terminal cleavage/methylation domain-containing protein [Parageobacillus toebii]KYD32814.1 hypothetical protein B4110_2619 [Parageobacillus toebii]